jgi:hypothetical protein
MWLSYDSVWNERDPNYLSFCGGDPVNGFDPKGKCVENAPPSLNFGTAPIMATGIETTTYLNNGSSFTTGLPNQPAALYDPNDVSGHSYNAVTQPTGQTGLYVGANPLPANYGQTTVTPITQTDIDQQQRLRFLLNTGTLLATALTGTEGEAPGILAAEDTIQIGYHATAPANVDSILANGLYDSAGGRLGGGGIYVNNTPEGAIAEYMSVPGRPTPTVLQVQYTPGLNYTITPPPTGYTMGPLPLAGDTLTTGSIRLPGTFNTIIRNGSATVVP